VTAPAGRTDAAPADAVGGDAASSCTIDVRLDMAAWATHLAEATATGLRSSPPWTPPVWFYDDVGSMLFDRITRLEEYYPTRAERSILTRHAAEIAATTGATTLAELGSGTSDKTVLLLDALAARGALERVVPFDVSEVVLRSAADEIAARYPGVAVHAVVGDFHEHLGALPTDGTSLLAFLGSTIGNLSPAERSDFLRSVRASLGDDDWFLLGTDLVKDPARLVAAYDDASGVTARFNLNALAVMNRELGADFDPGAWSHRAVYDREHQRIEMHVVAESDQVVHIEALDLELAVPAGGWIRTEISTKFTAEQVAAELEGAGLSPVAAWSDDDGDFLVTLARPR
jgi:L-histidine N-alpha-methyltransferase